MSMKTIKKVKLNAPLLLIGGEALLPHEQTSAIREVIRANPECGVLLLRLYDKLNVTGFVAAGLEDLDVVFYGGHEYAHNPINRCNKDIADDIKAYGGRVVQLPGSTDPKLRSAFNAQNIKVVKYEYRAV